VIRWFWRWGPVLAHMALIFSVSSLHRIQTLPADLSDKTGHFAAYALLGALVLRALANGRWSGVTGATAWRAWLIAAAYGASDEIHQLFVPGRTATVGDWIADTTGAAAAVLTLVTVARVARARADREV
jgi:VanZ family protein